MSKKCRKIWWKVILWKGVIPWKSGRYEARNRGHAVKQFRGQRKLSLRTDPETRLWKDVSVEPLKATP